MLIFNDKQKAPKEQGVRRASKYLNAPLSRVVISAEKRNTWLEPN